MEATGGLGVIVLPQLKPEQERV
uniref:Uncharacterized protein n=1 Tax=Anguilla anguilla TaxID=7936 RepID=A0A0E9PW35_ANGAN